VLYGCLVPIVPDPSRLTMAEQVVVEFGSTWCTHCEEMFPHFLRLSRQHPQHKYVLAQVDYMGDEAKVLVLALPLLYFWSRGLHATTCTSHHFRCLRLMQRGHLVSMRYCSRART